MKGTEHFTRTIAEYLNQRAMTDPLFAPNLLKPNKNIEECITYILNEVQKSGCNGFDDDEIFSMAVHYYDEDDIEVGKAVSCQVAVNHVVELTEEEKAEARQEAIKQYQREELAKLQSRNARVKKTENATTQVQPSLKSSRLFKSLQIERSLLSLCCEDQDKQSSHVRSTGQRYNKI